MIIAAHRRLVSLIPCYFFAPTSVLNIYFLAPTFVLIFFLFTHFCVDKFVCTQFCVETIFLAPTFVLKIFSCIHFCVDNIFLAPTFYVDPIMVTLVLLRMTFFCKRKQKREKETNYNQCPPALAQPDPQLD